MGEDWQVGLIMAEHILYDLPPVTPCEDAISREEVLLMIDNIKDNYGSLIDLAREVRKMLPVNPQRQIGHWIVQDVYNCHTKFKCSECGYMHDFMHLYGEPTADYTYCPKCGIKMVEKVKTHESTRTLY